MKFARIALLGTGLIGSSTALAIKAHNPTTRVVGYDTSGDNLRRAHGMKAIDSHRPMAEAVQDADLVIVATPLGAMQSIFEEIGPRLKQGAVVMDTGSTKGSVLAWAQALPEGIHFIGGHPMAGKTESGPDAAEATLFDGRVWCIVPSATASREAIEAVVKLVESFGAVTHFLDADEHDGLVAAVSHLPYLLAVALISLVGSERSWRETATLAAGGFAYGTHLASSDPRMFADIARSNRDSIVRRLDLYLAELQTLRDAIAVGDAGLKARFERARDLHLDWISGRAQQATEESNGAATTPSTRSMMLGGLFGRVGRGEDSKDKPTQ